MKQFKDNFSNSSKEDLKRKKGKKQYNQEELNQTERELKQYVNYLKKKTIFDLKENNDNFPKKLLQKNYTEENNKTLISLKEIKEGLSNNDDIDNRRMSHKLYINKFHIQNKYSLKKENKRKEDNKKNIKYEKSKFKTFSPQKSLESKRKNFNENRTKIKTYEKKINKKQSPKHIKAKNSNIHSSEKKLLEKKIQSKKYLLKKKDDFSLLKHPKIFKGENDSNVCENENNERFIELSNMNNKGIIQLNEIKQEIKNSLIGKSDINKVDSFKSYLSEENNDETLINDFDEKEKEKYRILTRKGYVYDSFDDEENIDEINYNFIHPNSNIIMIIDCFVFFFTFYNLYYIPLFLGKKNIYCVVYNAFYFQYLFNTFIDITFIIDFIISFFIAYYDFDEKLIFDFNLITKHYLRTWFFIDLLSALPLQTLFTIFNNKCKNMGFLVQPLFSKNFYYLWILLRLLKIFKVISKNKFLEELSDELSKFKTLNRYGKLIVSLFTFFISLHLVSCIFIFIGKNDYPNWIINFNFNDKDFKELYLITVYYIIETLTTVGYGDITCVSSSEKIYGLLMEVIGICVYSWALTEISNYIKVLNEKSEELNNKIQILDDIKFNYPFFPDNLYDKILRHLKYKYLYEKKDLHCFINELPNQLRNSLFYEMYKPIIKSFNFFRNFSNIDFIVNILISFKPILALRNDILVKDGDLIEDIIFVKKGKLSLEIPFIKESKKRKKNSISNKNSFMNNKTKEELIYQNLNSFIDSKTIKNKFTFLKTIKKEKEEKIQYFRILEIRRNEHFGDILMFLEQRSTLRLRVKSKKAELFYLNKERVIQISSSYPQYWKKINKKSLFNLKQIKRLINKISKMIFNEHGLVPKYDKNYGNSELKSIKDIEEDDLKSIPSISSSYQKSNEEIINEEENEESNNEREIINKEKENFENYLNKDVNIIQQNNNNNLNDNSLSNNSENNNEENEKSIINSNKNYLTPYDYDEINNEIYPEETFRVEPKFNPNYNFHNIENKKLENISICSTEISFCINSEYENIDELSNKNYSKDELFRNKVKNFIQDEMNKKNKSNFKINILQVKDNNNNINVDNNNNKKINVDNINNNNININNNNNNNNNNNIKINNNNNNNLLRNEFKLEFKNSLIQNINENNNLGVNQLIAPISSRSRKSFLSGKNSILLNRELNSKEDNKSNKDILSLISQKIEINNMNLNNPDLFYSQIFMKFMDEEIPKKEENSNIMVVNDEKNSLKNNLK